jgi:AcrR family transcriptional regulator
VTALIDAASEVFAELGFHGASLDLVADRAGLTKGAVYSNFRSKEDLFLALIDERLSSFMVGSVDVLTGAGDTLDERIAAIAELHERYTRDHQWALLYMEFYLYGMRHPEVGRRIIEHERAVFDQIVEIVGTELEKLGVVPPMPVDRLAAVLTAISEGLWLKQSLDADVVPAGMFRSALEFLAMAVWALGTTATAPSEPEPAPPKRTTRRTPTNSRATRGRTDAKRPKR